jgi:hypothetical protein
LKDELKCNPSSVPWALVIVTGPAGMLLAEMSTLWKSRAASWVRNGKPSIVTDGLTGRPFETNWPAMSFSATARATRSPITSRISRTTTPKTTMVQRRRRRRGLRPPGPPGAPG